MLPPILMLTTKKLAQNFLIFSIGFIVMAGATGCAPAGARALRKGERLIKEGKYSEAVKKFEEATTALPNNAKAWNHLGFGHQYAGDPKKAAQAYQQALSLDRNLATARYNLGLLHFEQRNFSGAIIELTTFTSLDAKNSEGWLKLGTAQMQLAALVSGVEKPRLLDAAKKNLDTAQKLHPSAEALNAMGMIQIQRGRPRDAIPSFTAALQQEADYAPALLNLAVVYHQYLNERRLALMSYRQFLKVAKDSPDAPRVQMVARQLENELNPPVAVANPPAVVPSKPQAPANISAPAKTEINLPKVVATPKPAPILSAPKAQPVPKKETPIEVARVPDEKPIKPAQDVLFTNSGKSLVNISNEPVEPPNPVRETKSSEKGSGLLTKLNPVGWFKRKLIPAKPTTQLPSAVPASETNASGSNPVVKVPATIEAKAKPTRSIIPRYRYRSPKKPSQGKRAEAEPFFAQGMKSQREQRLSDALAAYRQAIKLDPSFFEANYNLALAAREAGDLSATLSAYEHALVIMPESVNARYNFAFTLQEMGYFQDAANELLKLLEQNPNETRAHLLLGNLCAQRLDQTALAREHYLKVLEAEPQHPQATQIRYWLAGHS